MNTLQIDKVLSRNFVTQSVYIGCFPSDRLPNFIPTIPFCMVVNTDPSNLSGSHWIAIFCEKIGEIEYFDSLGIWPPISVDISSFLSQFTSIRTNTVPLQKPLEKTCGNFAIFFLYMRCSGFSMNKILLFLRRVNGDLFVKQFIALKLFNINN